MDEQNTIEEPGHPEELEQLLAWLRRRGTPLAAGAVIVLALIVAVLYARRRAEAGKNEAIVMLSSSRSIQDFESIVSAHPGSPAAPLALLRAAKGCFDTGSYAMALQKYSEFLDKHPDHAMAAGAELGKIHVSEAMGETEKALLDFIAFARAHPDHYLGPQAVLGQGRCLEQLQRNEEARTLYEDFLAENPQGAWAPIAEEKLELVNARIRKGEQAAATQTPGGVPGVQDFISPLFPAE